MISRPLLLAATLTFFALPAGAKKNSDAQRDLNAARMPATLFAGAAAPFELSIHFSARLGNAPADGDLLVKWKGKDQWWSKAVLGPFQQITIRDGGEQYTLRNADFTPIPVTELFYLIQLADQPRYIAQKEKERGGKGEKTKCIEAHVADDPTHAHELCLEPSSGELITDRWQEPMYQKRRREFSNYQEFDGMQYPKELKLFKNGSLSLSAEVKDLHAAAFKPALLTPPKGAIERRHCPGMKPPLAVRHVTPDEGPMNATGTSTFAVTVLADGSVGDIRLIGTGGKAIDKLAVAALKQWRFKPAMCGSEPVVADIEISFGRRSF